MLMRYLEAERAAERYMRLAVGLRSIEMARHYTRLRIRAVQRARELQEQLINFPRRPSR